MDLAFRLSQLVSLAYSCGFWDASLLPLTAVQLISCEVQITDSLENKHGQTPVTPHLTPITIHRRSTGDLAIKSHTVQAVYVTTVVTVELLKNWSPFCCQRRSQPLSLDSINDIWKTMEHWWNRADRQNQKYWDENLSQGHFGHHKFLWTSLRLNPILRGYRPASSLLTNPMARLHPLRPKDRPRYCLYKYHTGPYIRLVYQLLYAEL
jgi:hypothetical protein